MASLDTFRADAGDDPRWQPLFEAARLMLTSLRASAEGDDSVLAQIQLDVDKLGRSVSDHPDGPSAAGLLTAAMDLMTVRQRGGDVEAALNAVKTQSDQLPADSYVRTGMEEALAMLAPFRHMFGGPPEGAIQTAQQRAAAAASFDEQRATGFRSSCEAGDPISARSREAPPALVPWPRRGPP